jgi:hypothetical protein
MGNSSHVRAKALRLADIATELLTIARQVELDDAGAQLLALPGDDRGDLWAGPERRDHPLWAELARQHYRHRRLRSKIFGNEALFGEPAWDILLDLFIAAKEKRKVSVMSACIGSAVPSTTALRWISALEREGLITREDDPDDARRTYVILTEPGYNAMIEYFEAAAKSIKTAALLMTRPAPTEGESAGQSGSLAEHGPLRSMRA